MAKGTAKAADSRALWKYVVAGIAAFALIAILLSLFTGYRGVVRKMTRAVNRNKPKTLAAVLIDPNDGTDLELLSEAFIGERVRKSFDAAFDGKKYRVKSKITDVEKLGKTETEDFARRVDEAYDGDGPTVKKMVWVDVTLTAKAGGETRSQQWRFLIGKADGRWKILATEAVG